MTALSRQQLSPLVTGPSHHVPRLSVTGAAALLAAPDGPPVRLSGGAISAMRSVAVPRPGRQGFLLVPSRLLPNRPRTPGACREQERRRVVGRSASGLREN